MKIIEKLKLKLRANKYKNKNDKGGISYVCNSIKLGQTVLDIGAHKAAYLYFMRKQVGDKGNIYAFEPQLNLFKYIKKIKGLFNWDNITIEHLALSDSSGTVTLYIPSNKVSQESSPGATIIKLNKQSDYDRTEEVQTETLDSYCYRKQIKPDFIKIDVEGNELRIFRGGIETLKKYKPKILVEIEARHVGREKVLETFEFMNTFGYKGYIIHGLKNIPLNEFDFEKHQNTANKENYCNNFIFEFN